MNIWPDIVFEDLGLWTGNYDVQKVYMDFPNRSAEAQLLHLLCPAPRELPGAETQS